MFSECRYINMIAPAARQRERRLVTCRELLRWCAAAASATRASRPTGSAASATASGSEGAAARCPRERLAPRAFGWSGTGEAAARESGVRNAGRGSQTFGSRKPRGQPAYANYQLPPTAALRTMPNTSHCVGIVCYTGILY